VLKLSTELSKRLDLALWEPLAPVEHYRALCAGAQRIGARAVCVPSSRVALAASILEDGQVKVVGLAGFPLGNAAADIKRFEAEMAIDEGAQEIEFVPSYGSVKDGDTRGLLREFRDVVEIAEERAVCLIADLSWLSGDEVVQLCHLSLDAGISGICTATSFWQAPPGMDLVRLIREATTPQFIIKAPAQDEKRAAQMIDSGANRLSLTFQPGKESQAEASPA
jgi:deoxyribose-phosphate aldolase